MKKFYWNEDTINHFKFLSNYGYRNEVLVLVKEFVQADCSLEDGESKEELIIDLMNKIYE